MDQSHYTCANLCGWNKNAQRSPHPNPLSLAICNLLCERGLCRWVDGWTWSWTSQEVSLYSPGEKKEGQSQRRHPDRSTGEGDAVAGRAHRPRGPRGPVSAEQERRGELLEHCAGSGPQSERIR